MVIPITHTTTSSANVTPDIEALYSAVLKKQGLAINRPTSLELQNGDNIQFVTGPWAGIHGKVTDTSENFVNFSPFSKTNEIYQGTIQDARSLFTLGDLVEVQSGLLQKQGGSQWRSEKPWQESGIKMQM